MTEKGRLAVFTGVGQPLSLREYPLRDPWPGEVLVELAITNVCGSDLHVWRGDTGIGRAGGVEIALGHEMTGRVHKLGAGMEADALGRDLKEGDRVVFTYSTPCGHCLACLKAEPNACLMSLMTVFKSAASEPHFVGGFGEYYYVSAKQTVLKAPDTLSDETIAGVNCALSQVIYGLLQVDLRFGENVVIQGAGGLGLYATAVAREMGANKVIVIDGVAERLALARRMGADATIDIREASDPRERTSRVMALTDNWGADVVVEVVGIPDVMPEGVRMLGRGARYLTMGNITPRATYKEDPSMLVGGNRSIVGVSLYPPIILKRALDFLERARERLPLSEVVQKYPLDRIDEAFAAADLLGKGGSGPTRAAIAFGA